MFAALFGTLIDSVVKGAFAYLSSVMEKRGLTEQGMAAQAASETASGEAAQARMGQAVVDAPQTKDEALTRLRDGSA